MDLRLFGRVLWRYRLLIVGGWIVASLAAFLSFVSVGSDGATYRQAEKWSSFEDLYITERGFPEGRTIVGDPVEGAAAEGGIIFSDLDRLVGLTTVYAELVNSDAVKAIMLREGPIPGEVLAEQFTVSQGRTGLPVLRVTATAPSAPAAVGLAQRQTAAFQEYVSTEQEAAGIKARDRVVINVLQERAGGDAGRGALHHGACRALPGHHGGHRRPRLPPEQLPQGPRCRVQPQRRELGRPQARRHHLLDGEPRAGSRTTSPGNAEVGHPSGPGF